MGSVILDMKRLMLLFLLLPLSLLPLQAQTDSCQLAPLQVERLPDMLTARAGHGAFYINNELVVIGGHTDGFVPTATAEYLKDGQWHPMETIYPHDDGLALQLSSGKVLLAGGHSEALGIGQTFPAEFYYPGEHRFEGFSCLDRKRSLASAAELDNGRVLIAGNWYADDDMELFDGQTTFTTVKKVSANRGYPYVLRCGKNDVIVFGNALHNHQVVGCDTVDHLQGEPYNVPLLQTWQPMGTDHPMGSNSFIGDEAAGLYSYLLLARNDNGQMAFLRVDSTDFSLLPTASQLPTESPWDKIRFEGPVVVDRQRQRGYVVGGGYTDHRCYVLAVDYARQPAPLTLFYSEPLTELGNASPVMDDDGNLIISGGIDDSNFSPFRSVYKLHLYGSNVTVAAAADGHRFQWGWLWGLGVLGVVALAVWTARHMRNKEFVPDDDDLDNTEEADGELTADDLHHDAATDQLAPAENGPLRERLERLMAQERLYLNPQLKLSDLVRRLSSNRNYVYQALNVEMGMSFAEYVNKLRVDHAKRLMEEQHELSVGDVAMLSGFASNVSFYRNFKYYCGCSPKEYKKNLSV